MHYEPVLGPVSDEQTASHHGKSGWLPHGLRKAFLVSLIALVASLEVALAVIHSISERHSGLGDDTGEVRTTAARVAPTVLAVILCFNIAVLFQDVKRTEPFARLASKDGATADESLTWLPGAWWKVLVDSLRFGQTNWTMFCTSVVYILGILIVSPFSSTLIVPSDVVLAQQQPFSKLDLTSQMPMLTSPLSATYFRTISHVLYNATTSAWISDEHVILPFWPAEGSVALGPILSNSSRQWTAKTTVFSTDLDCEPLIQRPIEVLKENDTRAIFDGNTYNVLFDSESGCSFTVPGEDVWSSSSGGTTWAPVNNLTLGDFMWAPHYATDDDDPSEWAVNQTNCAGDEIVIFSQEPPVDSDGSKSSKASTGFHCTAQFFKGDVLATAKLGTGSSQVEIDENEYKLARTPIPSTEFNSSSFESVFLSSNWTTHVPASSTEFFAFGPGNLLSAPSNFSGTTMAEDSKAELLNEMNKIRSRFLGETFRDIFDSAASLEPLGTTGKITETRRRMLIVPSIAILLETALGLQLVLLISILIQTRLSRRPLEIRVDPAPTLNLAKLVANEPNTLRALRKNATTQSEVKSNLAGLRFKIENSHIYQTNAETDLGESKEMINPMTARTDTTASKAEAQPGFHYSVLFGFSIFITAVLVGVAVLYSYATGVGLYQKVFVYNVELSVAGVDLHGFNPALILTTFVAVCIGLWWGLIDTTYRKVQPFLTLAQKTTYLDKGPAISYESSYLLWGAFRAVKRHHWVLALVCTGTFLSQVLTISMASLWAQNPGQLQNNMTIERSLQLRTVPQYFPVALPQQGFTSDYRHQVLESLLGQVQASWVYGGAVQASLNGSDPAWGSDGWSFVPSHIPSLPDVSEVVNGNEVSNMDFNMTVKTKGVKARLECTPYENFNAQDTDTWLTKWEKVQERDDWIFNSSLSVVDGVDSGYELGAKSDTKEYAIPPLMLGKQYDAATDTTFRVQTNFFVSDSMLSCCGNYTDGAVGTASVGYWSWNNMVDASLDPDTSYPVEYPQYAGEWPANFTVKWIRGRPLENYSRNWSSISSTYDPTATLLWADKPDLVALNCQPVIETNDAQVTVDPTGQVLNYVLQNTPSSAPEAWEDQFRLYENEGAGYNRNATVSYGVQFLMTLLGAANPSIFTGAYAFGGAIWPEDIDDQSFTIKQPGLNADLMSYSMLGATGNDHDALLDHETLARAASTVFSTFFQNFATFNTSTEDGGYVFQRAGEKLPADIGKEDTDYDLKRRQSSDSESDKPQDVIISRSADRLEINLPAAWLSILILAYLLVICLVSAIASLRYSKLLLRRIETIADVGSLIAGSPKLLDLARRMSEGELKYMVRAKARLGWFRDERGADRWGIELVEPAEGQTSYMSEKEMEAEKRIMSAEQESKDQMNVSAERRVERDSEGISLMSA